MQETGFMVEPGVAQPRERRTCDDVFRTSDNSSSYSFLFWTHVAYLAARQYCHHSFCASEYGDRRSRGAFGLLLAHSGFAFYRSHMAFLENHDGIDPAFFTYSLCTSHV